MLAQGTPGGTICNSRRWQPRQSRRDAKGIDAPFANDGSGHDAEPFQNGAGFYIAIACVALACNPTKSDVQDPMIASNQSGSLFIRAQQLAQGVFHWMSLALSTVSVVKPKFLD